MKNVLFYFLIYILLIVFSFRSLLSNLGRNLLDWHDYPLMVWIILQNVSKIKNLDFLNFFDTNAFYPHKYSLLFSDTLITQSLIALPLSFFSDNHILIFNVVFIITLLLNYLSSYLFWRLILKKDFFAFIGALLTCFSPFFHLQLSHFQMLNFWPFFFCLYFLVKGIKSNQYKQIFISSLFLSLQFLASVYLAVFLLSAIALFLFSKFNLKPFTIKSILLIVVVFLLINGVVIKGYLDMKSYYQIERDIKEYINYSAHLTDYLFSKQISSLLHNNPIIQRWNSFDKHSVGELASFPGFLLTILSSLGLFFLSLKRSTLKVVLELNQERTFFLLLLVIGLIFSLGPRLNVNGNYAHIPLPYYLLLKLPLFEAIRAEARWSFLFYLGLTYFSLFGMAKLLLKFNKKTLLFSIIFFLLFTIEYIPLNIQTHAEQYTNPDYLTLKDLCKTDKKVLLEVPITHFDVEGGIIEGLNYISKTELSSLHHNCLLINGYSGYDLPQIQKAKDEFYFFVEREDPEGILTLLQNKGADLLKVNPERIDELHRANLSKIIDLLVSQGKLLKVGENIYATKSYPMETH